MTDQDLLVLQLLLDLAVLQSQINALGTNLNIVGFYDAVAGVVTTLTVVGQEEAYTGIGQTLASSGITTGDYFIVAKGGADVGIELILTQASPVYILVTGLLVWEMVTGLYYHILHRLLLPKLTFCRRCCHITK